MKRSEMLTKLIEKYKDIVNTSVDEMEITSKLLVYLENEGMLPPPTTYWNRDKQGNLKPDGRNGDVVHRWDSE